MSAGPQAQVQQLLAEAAEWRLLSLFFDAPEGNWRKLVEHLAASVPAEELRATAELALQQAEAPLFYSLFGPGGPAQLREAAYRQSLELGYLLSELGAFYQAFAFDPRTEEPVDHLAIETAFISYLRMKEAYAIARGAEEEAAVTRDAAREFLRQHLAYIAEPLAAALARPEIEYLQRASANLLERVGPAPARFPIVAGNKLDDSNCEMTCGV